MSQVQVTMKQKVRRWDKKGGDSEFPHLLDSDHEDGKGPLGPLSPGTRAERVSSDTLKPLSPSSLEGRSVPAAACASHPVMPARHQVPRGGGGPASNLETWAESSCLLGIFLESV